jgi:hypothetical protein
MEKIRVSVMWRNGSMVDIASFDIIRKESLLDDIRRELKSHPVMGDVYWRDDVFDSEVFHAHRKVKYAFDSLGESVGTAYIVK